MITIRPHSLSIWQKIAYGAGDSGFSLMTTALALLYLDFLINIVGLDPQLAGVSIGLGRIWDAINDLIVGALSDRTRSRWGRRRPYLLFGSIPLGIAFVLMWVLPPANGQIVLAIYYTAMYVVFDTLFSLVYVPYIALTPELAPTYDERTSLHAYRMVFTILFGLLGAVVPLAFIDALTGSAATLADRQSAYALMSMLLGGAGILPIYLTFFTTRERPEFQSLPTPSLRQSFKAAVSNKAFLIAAGIYLLAWLPIDLIQFVLVFWIRDYFHLGNSERDLIFALIFGVAALTLPLWVWAAGRWNKQQACQVGLLLLAGVLVALSFVSSGQSQSGLVFGLMAIAGVGVSAVHALPLAILPDTIEWDDLRTGSRQEAAYYSVITLIQKLINAVTISLTGTLLSTAGYVPGAALQPASALAAIRLLTGLLPAAILIAGTILVAFHPISRERHARVLRALTKQRARRARLTTIQADRERLSGAPDRPLETASDLADV